ncbi:MAG: hypothetical protein GY913_04730 [Proteobacteria bacterium]|nr:hypothetical protein [Pseudomonadota bacterium]
MLRLIFLLGCGDIEGDEAGECTDGKDNDNNGVADCRDPGCEFSPDCTDGESTVWESPPLDSVDTGGETGETGPIETGGETGETGHTGETGDTGEVVPGTDTDGDGVPDEDDCAPDDPNISPLGFEWDDGVDNDCDGDTDELVMESPWATLVGGNNDRMGKNLVAVPDRDGDGLPGIALSGDEGKTAQLYVLDGLTGGTVDISAGYTMLVGSNYDGVGQALGAGDFDGDGLGDVLIGARYEDTGAGNDNRGWVGIVTGTDTGSLEYADLLSWRGSEDNDELGETLSGLGDTDGDGIDDLAMGAQGVADPTVWVLPGGSLIGGEPGDEAVLSVRHSANDGWGGMEVWEAGDLDGDGLNEVLISYMYEQGWQGTAWVFEGGVTGEGLAVADADITWGGPEDGGYAWMGEQAAGVGDYDGDGLDDVLLGASIAGGSNTGAAYLMLGGTGDGSVDDVAHLTIEGGDVTTYVGAGVAGGDLDGDGRAELLVGAGAYGYVFAYDDGLSGTVTDGDAGLTLNDDGSDTFFGEGLTFLGDVNGDGQANFAASGWQRTHGEASEGEALHGETFIW